MPPKKHHPDIIDLNPAVLVEIVRRLLRVGVPPTAIANAFDMEPGPIKIVARSLRRETYGTDELSEATAFLTWLAYEQILGLVMNGSPEIKLKAAMQIQGKAMMISQRQTPEEVKEARAEFAALIEDIEISETMIEEEAQHYEDVRREYVPADDET